MNSEGPMGKPRRGLRVPSNRNDGLRVTTVALVLEPTNDVIAGVEFALAAATTAGDDDIPDIDLLPEEMPETPEAHFARIIALINGSVPDPNLPPESGPENRSAYVKEVYIRATTEDARELCEKNEALF